MRGALLGLRISDLKWKDSQTCLISGDRDISFIVLMVQSAFKVESFEKGFKSFGHQGIWKCKVAPRVTTSICYNDYCYIQENKAKYKKPENKIPSTPRFSQLANKALNEKLTCD